ncbi:peptidase domain-containing ABC transporter [Olivibacter sp. SDN3]|uniref:peptidase domain-containing ABC transporter n=1 Tax=Olivibacter sp. SDN3 TaxID=2764720 RepID=UPI00165160FD|nr:peptidase domain-containing ABC transporter [Olivibacter sp. SDN3]QNL50728.1 peptidase domain-containing ABC transporter [Olivibacter sp. SDN3]
MLAFLRRVNPFSFVTKRSKKVYVRQHGFADCGAACLASIAAFYKLEVPLARIRQYASTDKKGTNVLGLMEAATKMGFSAKGVRGSEESLPEVPCPAIAHVVLKSQLNHYVVIYNITKTYVEVMDPAIGTIEKVPLSDFKAIWTGVLLLLTPSDNFFESNQKVSVTSRFIYLIQPHKHILWQVLAGAIFFTLLGLSTSIYIQKIVDHVLPTGNKNLLNLMGVVMIVLLLVKLFINHVRTLLTIKTGQQIDARLILGYYKHLLTLPQTFFDNMRVGEIISRINDAAKIRAFINEVLVDFAVNIFIIVFSFLLMFTYYWKLALVMLGVIPLFGCIYYISNRLNKKTQRKLMEDAADLEAQLVESVNAVGTIKRFGVESFANFKTETSFVKLLKSIYTSSTNSLWIGNVNGLVSGLFVIILLWMGSLFVLDKLITPGELLSFYAIIGYFMGPVGSLITMNKTIQDAVIAADRLFEVMDLERERKEEGIDLTKVALGDISFVDVAFRYGTRVTVFEGLNVSIPHGKVVAIVGESGSGKTTLLSLLQNIYPLLKGRIMIGDHDLNYVTNESLRKVVGVVPQHIDLFAGNVVENIALGDADPDMNKIAAICKELEMLRFIEHLPNGFKTYIGENGTSLSGGQRQRLAIARALYRDPQILILDEATASLDSGSEEHVQRAIQTLRKKNKTIILIAHRLSTVADADKIIVLKDGLLIEEGSHDRLLSQRGVYYAMWQKQFPKQNA